MKAPQREGRKKANEKERERDRVGVLKRRRTRREEERRLELKMGCRMRMNLIGPEGAEKGGYETKLGRKERGGGAHCNSERKRRREREGNTVCWRI